MDKILRYKLHQQQKMLSVAKKCDFNVDDYIRNFNGLKIEVQKRLLREELRRKKRVRTLSERLHDYKQHKAWSWDDLLKGDKHE